MKHIFIGRGMFISEDTIEVEGKKLKFDKVPLALILPNVEPVMLAYSPKWASRPMIVRPMVLYFWNGL